MIGPATQDDTSAPLSARIGTLLERQHELLVRLDEMSLRQSRLIADDRADLLLDLLGERQHVIDQLQQAATALEPLRAAWGETVATLPDAVQDAVRRRLDGVSMLIDRINARDEECRRALSKRRDEVALELLNIGRGRGAVSAYAGSGSAPGASFQDREA